MALLMWRYRQPWHPHVLAPSCPQPWQTTCLATVLLGAWGHGSGACGPGGTLPWWLGALRDELKPRSLQHADRHRLASRPLPCCSDHSVLEQNYMNKMRYSPDYKGVDVEQALKDFKDRIRRYEEVRGARGVCFRVRQASCARSRPAVP